MPGAIEAEHLSFKYTRTLVLEDVSFCIEEGDYVGLIGPNGGGKTTLLKLVLGLEKGAGKIKLFGVPLADFKEWQKIGYLAQKSPVSQTRFPVSVEEVVLMGLCYDNAHKEPTLANLKEVYRALTQTRTRNLAKRIFSDLSVGQQQRVLLARALVSKPRLLILDEPSAAMDAASREMFFDLLGELNQKHGVTILLITHDTGEVGKYISKFMYIDKELVFFGDKQAFCQSKKVAEKLGPFAQHTIDHLHNNGHCPLGCHCDDVHGGVGHYAAHGAEAAHKGSDDKTAKKITGNTGAGFSAAGADVPASAKDEEHNTPALAKDGEHSAYAPVKDEEHNAPAPVKDESRTAPAPQPDAENSTPVQTTDGGQK